MFSFKLMNFQYASDLHLEFAQNKKVLSKKPILPTAEILLLAGDVMPICDIAKQQDFFNYISDHFKMTYWLPGNHEYFGSDVANHPISFEESIRKNILLLNHQVKTIEDEVGKIDLVFSTLWSNIPFYLYEIVSKRMRDFSQIQFKGKGISVAEYNQLHRDSVDFLSKSLENTQPNSAEGHFGEVSKSTRKLVISHHLPSFLNYPKKHQNDPINAGFATNLDDFIVKMAPNAWIFGHHHFNLPPFFIGKTQLFTNQLGYIKYKEDKGFDRQAVLSI